MAALQAAESGVRHHDGSVEDFLIGAWDWDIGNDRLYADARFARIFGISAQEAADGPPQQQWMQSIHPDDRPAVNAAVEAALRGALFDQEYRVVAEGKTRWVYARGRCTMNKVGKAERFAGAIVDISHEKAEDSASIVPS